MRLRKKIISVALAVCMAVTILSSGIQLNAMAAEAEVPEQPEDMVNKALLQKEPALMPEILQKEAVPGGDEYGIGTLAGEEDTYISHLSRKYISTGETNFSFTLYLTESPYTDGNDHEYIAYLFDKDDKIAAKSVDPQPIYENGTGWNIDFYGYRARELKAGEELYVGYSSINGEVHRLKDVTLTVTDQPYIYSVGRSYRVYLLYSGEDDTSIISISGYNIDFNRLSVSLKDISTGDTVATSVRCIEECEDVTYYLIKWNNPEEQHKPGNYTIEYSYAVDGVNLVTEDSAVSYSSYTGSNNITYNRKTDTVEYYNRELPAGAEVSYEVKEYSSQPDCCVSGSGITVSDSHLIKINLKDKLPYDYNREYYLVIKYKDGEQEKSWNKSFEVYEDIKERITWHILNAFYTTDDNEIEISAEVYSDDVLSNETKLADTCKVNILKYNKYSDYTDDTVGEVELKLKKEGNKILYYGIFNRKLDLGYYRFSFSPDGENVLRYCFDVYDSSKLYLNYQENNIEQGIIIVGFGNYKTTEWYCKNPENLNKLIIKIVDIEGNEIGTYKYFNGDFTVDDSEIGYTNISINLSDKVKEVLDNIYYCNVYFYYGDVDTDDTIAKYAYSIYQDFETENFYDIMYYQSECIRWTGNNSWIRMAASMEGNSYYSGSSFYDESCNTVMGNDSAFPAKLTITDWYGLKTLKEIIISEPNHIFTESELDGLSSTNMYNFFLKGADGSVSNASGYIDTGDEEYRPASSPTPSRSPSISGTAYPGSGSSGGGSYIPSGIGGANIQQTTAPTVQPEATAVPTAVPTQAPTTQPTAVPEATAVPKATAAPAATAPPAEVKEPETPVTNNPYVPSQEEKPVLKLKKNKITLKKGQKAKIKITSKLATSITYKSLKPSVATVSKKGVITAKKAGKAVITVKANGLVKKVQVTVKKASKIEDKTESTVKTASSVKLGKDFKLAKASVTIKKGKKLTIKKVSGLSGKVTFRSLDKKIASVSVNGVVKAKKKGKTTILIKKGNKTIKLKITVKK